MTTWLDGAFSAGDLLMVTVLRRVGGSGGLENYANLGAYIARGEARPAYVSKEELPDKHDVVIDSRIVTAMFLPSSAAVAQEMVNLMK